MVTSEQLDLKLKNGEISGVYLFYGKELFLLENAVKKIKKNMGNLIEGLNFVKLDDSNIDGLITEIQTPAFGFEKKLIIVKDTELLKKQAKKKSQVIIDKIEEIAGYLVQNKDDIESSTIIIFIQDDAEKNALYKAIDEEYTVCEFKQEKMSNLINRMKFICNSYSVNIANDVLAYFVESCGMDLQNLINEIRKLIEYAGPGGTITKEDIDALSIKQFESVIFDLTDNLGQKNISKSIDILKNLIAAKEPVQKILITLYNHFKKLYITKICVEDKLEPLQYLNLKPNQTFLVSKYKRQASYFYKQELKRIMFMLIELDEKYKAGSIDLNLGLESVLCAYCSK